MVTRGNNYSNINPLETAIFVSYMQGDVFGKFKIVNHSIECHPFLSESFFYMRQAPFDFPKRNLSLSQLKIMIANIFNVPLN